jgi:nitroreductase
MAALQEYIALQIAGQPNLPTWVQRLTCDVGALWEAARGECGAGGTTKVSRESIQRGAASITPAFFATRHSIRGFAERHVTWDELAEAVDVAQRTPSVCNRQSWRVHAFERGPKADAVLACQNGNNGWGQTASHVLILTVDLRTFVYLGERNQPWIDGGMFAMSLVYAFHAAGIGTCCLNWSVESTADRRLRAVADIPGWEAVVMMLAVGHLPDVVRVTQSQRHRPADVLKPGALRTASGRTSRARGEPSARTTSRG